MAMSQFDVIKSLGEALSWFERETTRGAQPGELNFLTGRIGELYTAMFTYGQMADKSNQRGYDVVSAEGERISVKTITSSTQVSFNENTFDLVDRVVVLRINVKELAIDKLMDSPVAEARKLMRERPGRWSFSTYRSPADTDDLPRADLLITKQAAFSGLTIRQYENGTVEVLQDDKLVKPALPFLRSLSMTLGIDHLNSTGTPKNTRYLGDQIIRELLARKEEMKGADEDAP